MLSHDSLGLGCSYSESIDVPQDVHVSAMKESVPVRASCTLAPTDKSRSICRVHRSEK